MVKRIAESAPRKKQRPAPAATPPAQPEPPPAPPPAAPAPAPAPTPQAATPPAPRVPDAKQAKPEVDAKARRDWSEDVNGFIYGTY